MFKDYAPFDRDGRLTAATPTNGPYTLIGTYPTSVTNATARRLIDELWRHGMSTHSAMGSTLWVLICWCQRNNRSFEVWKWPEGGYCLHLDKINPAISTEGAEKVL